MKRKIFALVDCNSFYCSCERVFHPNVLKKPVVVLSNNDGCMVSLTPEAKALGLKMGEPYFKIKQIAEENDVAIFSSNYALYADMSQRVMNTLKKFTQNYEIYSIDEAFLDLTLVANKNLDQVGREISATVLRDTGIPVSVGIARTKVLAKLANRIAKKSAKCKGVLDLTDTKYHNEALSIVDVGDIWGIGRKSAVKLKSFNIKNAREFRDWNNEALVKRLFTKTGLHLQQELRGISCIPFEKSEAKKTIACTRTFGCEVMNLEVLKESVATFTTSAAERLRSQECVAGAVMVFILTNIHRKEVPQYNNKYVNRFLTNTSDTIKLIKEAHVALEKIYRSGFEYKKAGVVLLNIVPANKNQLSFIDTSSQQEQHHISAIDAINQKYGTNTIKSAACGIKKKWKMNSDFKSSSFTTSWDNLLLVD